MVFKMPSNIVISMGLAIRQKVPTIILKINNTKNLIYEEFKFLVLVLFHERF